MPQLGPKFRRKKTVYWALIGNNTDGSPRFAAPVEINVRWNNKQEEFLDKEGRTQVAKAAVHMDREPSIGGYLRFGLLADLTSQTRPQANRGAEEIRGLRSVDNFKGTETFHRAFVGGSTHG